MLTVHEVRKRVAALKNVGELSPDGHMEEDEIRQDVLQAIADGAENARELAAAALETARYDFPRWYE